MNRISPQMLGVTSGAVTLIKSSSLSGDHGPDRPATLKRFLRPALRWRWVLIGGVVVGAALGGLVTLLSHRQYASTERLQITRETAQVVNMGAISHDVSIGDQEFYQTQYGLMRTQALAERVAQDVGVVEDPAFFRMFGKSAAFLATSGRENHASRRELAGHILLDHVVVAPVHGSSLVDVEATTPSAALSLKIAQRWSEDFIASALERRVDMSGYAHRYLESRIDQLRDRLQTSERRAVEYANAQGIIDLSSPGNNISGQSRLLVTDDLIATDAAREAAAADRIGAASRLAAASAQPGDSSDALNYRAIGLMRKARADVDAERAKLSAQLPPGDPAARAVHAQIDALDTAIQDEQNRVRGALQQTYQAANARETALTRRVQGLKGSLASQRARSIQYNIYQRDVETNRILYEGLLQRYKEIGVAGGAENNNVAVVDPAMLPIKPSSPRIVLNLLLSMLAGTATAILAVILLEQIRDEIADPETFGEKLSLPLLGVTPKLKALAPLEGMKDPRSAFAEACLVLEANLKFSTLSGIPQSLAVVSTGPGEGKTTTAIALAQTLVRARRTVVVIDANLRAPSVHTALGLENSAGLSDYLLGAGGDPETVLRSTPFEGLWAISAGVRAPNPADLLIGAGLARLVKTLQDRFDHVIIDGPAMTDIADAPLIASAVDGVLYVVSSGSAPSSRIRDALSRLDQAEVLGGVLTKAATSRAPGRFVMARR